MRIRNRDELLYQLAVACELEQGLCLQYLFTAFSLKDSFSEGGIHTQEQLNFVRMWKANMFLVGAQEMLHLTQAANLCAAAGGAVQLRRPNFPQPDDYYPTNLPWRLDPFSSAVLRRYAWYERPAEWPGGKEPFDGKDTISKKEQAVLAEKYAFRHLKEHKAELHRKKAPRRVEATTIGELYEAIRLAYVELPNLIIGSPDAQIDGGMIDFPQVVRVESREDAARGIDLIIAQGEGSRSDRLDSHYGVFLNIYKQYKALKAKDKDFAPVRPVSPNPLSRLHVDNSYPGFRLIDDEFTVAVNDLNSEVYATMLLLLYRFFATTAGDRAQRKLLSGTFLRIMTGILKPLGEALTKLPMGAETPGLNAGPSYEVNRAVQLMPHERSSQIYLTERLYESSRLAADLAADPRCTNPEVKTALVNVGLTLHQLAAGFAGSMSQSRE